MMYVGVPPVCLREIWGDFAGLVQHKTNACGEENTVFDSNGIAEWGLGSFICLHRVSG